jgi:hypothetical protein
MRSAFRVFAVGSIVALVALLPAARRAAAVPSFARQTGLSCNACHTTFPQLNQYGRSFKLEGYTTLGRRQRETAGSLPAPLAPVALMWLTSYTSTAKAQAGTQNGNVLLPDEASLFYAGRIADHLGAFLQFTYEGAEDHFSMDMADVRFAHRGAKDQLLYGLTLNNNPTVEDVWNSTPAWGFPFASSGVAPTPAATTLVEGALAQQVAGLGGYLWWKSTYYGAVAVYRSSPIGVEEPPSSTQQALIQGTAPYWRLAWSRTWGKRNLELGTYGLSARIVPAGVPSPSGPTDHFLDVAVDGQFQWQTGGPHTVTVRSTWIHETRDWNASFPAGSVSRARDVLRTFKASGSYHWKLALGGAVAWFDTSGDSDPALYPPVELNGSRTGSPDSRGFVLQVDCLPWRDAMLSAQYTIYTRFNGAATDYDGFGRSASDNDTLYVSLLLAF